MRILPQGNLKDYLFLKKKKKLRKEGDLLSDVRMDGDVQESICIPHFKAETSGSFIMTS